MISSGYLLFLGVAINVARAWPSQSFKTESFAPPVFNITKSGAPLAPGLIFLTPAVVNGSQYGVIITDEGELVWSTQNQVLADLAPQTLDDEPVLVYWDGAGSPLNGGTGYGQVGILDSTYNQLYKICPNFGLVGATSDCQADVHEAYVTDRGSLIVSAYNATPADLTSIDGPTDGWVLDSMFYEIDIKTQEILFSWSALNAGIPVNATKQAADGEGSSQEHPLDYFHINSVQPVGTGYIVNSRNCWTMFMVDSNGEIQWELEGSTGGDFTLSSNVSFSWEHNPRAHNVTSTGLVITLFDNANGDSSTTNPSTGQMLFVNLTSMSATLLEKSSDPNESLYSSSQGSNQVLSNKNFLVGYGAIPEVKEFGPDGDLRMKIVFGDSGSSGSYRAFRMPWTAVPSAEPKVVADNGTAYMSWNGATNVTSWAIYEGRTSDTLEMTSLIKRTGFETSTAISNGTKFVQTLQNLKPDLIMGGPNLVTALRGFKIRTATLDKYLIDRGKPAGTNSATIPPYYDYDTNGNATDEISEVLRASSSIASVLLVMPSVEGHDRSSWAYVAYSCAHIYAQRHITPQDPDEQVPVGFEELRQDVLKYSPSSEEDEGLMGLFVVITEARPGPTPPELRERWKTPILCGLCEQTFEMWSTRQGHRNEVHGLNEELDALPANA